MDGRTFCIHCKYAACRLGASFKTAGMQAGRFENFRLDQLLRMPVQPINRCNLFLATVTSYNNSTTSFVIISPADVESLCRATLTTVKLFYPTNLGTRNCDQKSPKSPLFLCLRHKH
ncbi:5-formaminoimidazole-4-carboxamide-1-(beta)-D-ribofuranosyl 5'-monophosphate synthetase [Trichinella pseudospiralis]